MIPLEEFIETQQRIKPYVKPSLLQYSEWLSDKFASNIYLKLECLQPGRSFKIRGATNALLSQERLPERVVTASGGNHGLGVAIASQRIKVPCKVVLPKTTSQYRIDLLESKGATVELKGDSWDDANEYALQLAEDKDTLYIHPFADREVMLGQGTIALELVDEFPEMDMLVASVGGGGLLGGNALALEAMEKQEEVEMVAVETKGTDSLAQSLEAKQLIELPAITSIAKTLGARKTTAYIFETMQRLIDHSLVVDDKSSVRSLFDFLNHEKILVEPATSCIFAAMEQNEKYFEDKNIVVIVCGSNVTLDEAEGWRKDFL